MTDHANDPTAPGADRRDFLTAAGLVGAGLALAGAAAPDAEAAGDGRYEPYKLSLKFDNPQARWAHGFPLDPTQKEVQEMLFKEAGGP